MTGGAGADVQGGTTPSPSTPARAQARALLRRTRGRRPPRTGDRRRLRLVVAYDGTNYAGWQRQGDRVSVQEILETALEQVVGHPVRVAGSGRTDAGVHAEGQVAAFDTTADLPPRAFGALLGQILPHDVRIGAAEACDPDFDPQRAARSKLYRYTLLAAPGPCPARERTAWRLETAPDPARMRAAAAHLVGTHDFRGFRTDPGPLRRDEDTVRTVERIGVEPAGDLLLVEVEGRGFLYMMVRNITAALVLVGHGGRDPSWVAEVLAARDRTRLPPPAPAKGLCLVRVVYG